MSTTATALAGSAQAQPPAVRTVPFGRGVAAIALVVGAALNTGESVGFNALVPERPTASPNGSASSQTTGL